MISPQPLTHQAELPYLLVAALELEALREGDGAMFDRYRSQITTALGAVLLLIGCDKSPPRPEVQVPIPAEARPRDATANLPSDTGSQTALPTGAVTGAGQPQGTTMQADVGAPGGLERRARTQERAGPGASQIERDAPSAAGRSDASDRDAATSTRPRRQSKG